MTPSSDTLGPEGQIPVDTAGRAIWLVRAVGVPVAICAVVIYQSWQLTDSLREEGKEREEYARETLRELNSNSVKGLALATEAINAQTEQSKDVTVALEEQSETNVRVCESLSEMKGASKDLQECAAAMREHVINQ